MNTIHYQLITVLIPGWYLKSVCNVHQDDFNTASISRTVPKIHRNDNLLCLNGHIILVIPAI